MNIEQGTGLGHKEEAVQQKRRGYESPTLTAYGAIHHATQGTGGQGADGMLGMTMM